MSARRLGLTVLAMGCVGFALAGLGPDPDTLVRALTGPQRLADAAGPEAVVVAWAGLLAWAVWAWGLLGLALTAASALPGLLGDAARLLLRCVLPASARRAAAVALGIGLGVGLGAPALARDVPLQPHAVTAPDWPVVVTAERAVAPPAAAPPAPTGPSRVPDWPAPAAGEHVVVRGDCLWDIAADHLRSATGRAPAEPEITAAVGAWWTANASVIGPDPDLLLPGQVLRPPPA